MIKVMLVAIVSVLIIIPVFGGCTPSSQTSQPVAVDNQSVKSQAPVAVDSETVKPTTEDAAASKAKGFVYESFAGGTQIYYMKENVADRVKLGIANKSNGEPAWSPDSKKVAFVSEGSLYMTDLGSENITKLANVARNPVWSPDSKKIAYILDGDRATGPVWNTFYDDSLYVINADGTDSNKIAEKSLMFSPMWSPDSKKLVFVTVGSFITIMGSNHFGNAEIYVVNADGSYGTTNITNTVDASEKDPRWSPDGQYIAFLSNKGDGSRSTNDSWNLYVMRNDGTEVRKLNADSTVWNGYAGQSRNYENTIGKGSLESPQDRMSEMYGPFITWSPDGRYITVSTVRAQGPRSFSPGGTGVNYSTISMSPGQFPVGSLIVFDAQTGKEISAVKAGKRSVCWSPDSKRICYIPPSGSQSSDQLVGYRQIMASNLIIMDPDGGNPQTIYDFNADGYLNWNP